MTSYPQNKNGGGSLNGLPPLHREAVSVDRSSLEQLQFNSLKDKLLNGEIKMEFKAGMFKRRGFHQGSPSPLRESQATWLESTTTKIGGSQREA